MHYSTVSGDQLMGHMLPAKNVRLPIATFTTEQVSFRGKDRELLFLRPVSNSHNKQTN